MGDTVDDVEFFEVFWHFFSLVELFFQFYNNYLCKNILSFKNDSTATRKPPLNLWQSRYVSLMQLVSPLWPSDAIQLIKLRFLAQAKIIRLLGGARTRGLEKPLQDSRTFAASPLRQLWGATLLATLLSHFSTGNNGLAGVGGGVTVSKVFRDFPLFVPFWSHSLSLSVEEKQA